jgi:hypothetical protein
MRVVGGEERNAAQRTVAGTVEQGSLDDDKGLDEVVVDCELDGVGCVEGDGGEGEKIGGAGEEVAVEGGHAQAGRRTDAENGFEADGRREDTDELVRQLLGVRCVRGGGEGRVVECLAGGVAREGAWVWVGERGGVEERRSGGAEERRSGGAEERRSGGAEERPTERCDVLVAGAAEEHINGDMRAGALDCERLVERRGGVEERRFLQRCASETENTGAQHGSGSDGHALVVPYTLGSSRSCNAPAPTLGRLEETTTSLPPIGACMQPRPSVSTVENRKQNRTAR